ncbi:hypothetical protein EON81_05935 [bacterium]|nr:MAG: hypothetical protein EON81_05935 [bacterium]
MRGLIFALFLLPVLASAQDVATLKKRAEETTKKIGELAQSGKLPTDDQALKLMEEMVAELKAIRVLLQKLEGTGTPVKSLSGGSGIRIGGYLQFQYANTDVTDQYDAFTFRRLRPTFEYDINPQFSARISFDLATGSNRYGVQGRDVWIAWQPNKSLRMRAGQPPLPLGYEQVRSSQERETPERSQYNQILFNTERSRGVEARVTKKGWEATAGLYNALTVNDPEQLNRAPGPDSRQMAVVQGALTGKNGRIALSGAYGERPSFTSGNNFAPAIVRKFGMADFEWRRGRLTLRGEGFFGRDRLPGSFPGIAQDMAGGHLQGVWKFDPRNLFAARYEMFDPSRKNPGDAIFGWNLSYIRELGFNTRLMFSQEFLRDGRRDDPSVGITTLRLQVRF